MNVGEKLKKERLLRKITQASLAKSLGVSRTTLCDWESGKRVPAIKHIRTYCQIFGLPPDFFEEKSNITENIGVSFDLSCLNYKGIKKMQEFYNDLIKNEEYVKKS